MAKFKTGDTVRLVSGGPLMTIEEYHGDYKTRVWCSWFDDAEHRLREVFDEKTLIADSPNTRVGFTSRKA